MAINRAALPQQLQAGAPDLRLTGDQRHRGIMSTAPQTYTQRRRAQMAGGGIMGSNAGSMLVAPTADGSRPGYADWWNPLTWAEPIVDVAKKVGQTIIPGGEQGYFDLYGGAGDVAKKVGETIIPGGEPGYGDIYGATGDVIKKVGETIIPGGEKGYFDLYGGLANLLPYMTNQNLTSNINWGDIGEKYLSRFGPAVAGGLLAGKMQQDYLDRQPGFPADPTSVNIPQTAQAAMDDPNLRFKPKEQYADLAKGGRIGYSIGGNEKKDVVRSWSDYVNSGGRREFESWFRDVFLPSTQSLEGTSLGDITILDSPLPQKEPWLEKDQRVIVAQGGRIGYEHGGRHLFSPSTWFSGGPESETNPTGIGTQDALLNRASIAKLKNAINLYETQIQNADQLGGLSEEAQADYDLKIKQLEALEQGAQGQAQGGRVAAQEGGLMNLGGMEKDYRQEGGFVPIGGEEKADDVPARLSKNEFVFTADAVRAAGGGDIDAGAEVMENVMENLEAGGKVSEESQGLEGAREMFANAQELQKRII